MTMVAAAIIARAPPNRLVWLRMIHLRAEAEQGRPRALGAERRHHEEKMGGEHQMAGGHQGATHAARLEPRNRDLAGIDEGSGGIEHGQSLTPAADAQR